MAKPFIEFVHPDDRERTLKQNGEVRGGGRALSFENRYQCKDGSYRWFRWNAAPDSAEQVIYSAARDVTVRKQAEEARTAAPRTASALAESNTSGNPADLFVPQEDPQRRQPLGDGQGYISQHTNSTFSPASARTASKRHRAAVRKARVVDEAGRTRRPPGRQSRRGRGRSAPRAAAPGAPRRFDAAAYFRGADDLGSTTSARRDALARRFTPRIEHWAIGDALGVCRRLDQDRYLEVKSVSLVALSPRLRADHLGVWKHWLAANHSANWADRLDLRFVDWAVAGRASGLAGACWSGR
jgi:hypothetical protein